MTKIRILNGLTRLIVGMVVLSVGGAAQSARAREMLRFRHTKPATVHFLNAKAASDYERRLKDVGCATKLTWHWGHIDLTFQCEEWHEMHLERHEDARQWMELLASFGFETGHFH